MKVLISIFLFLTSFLCFSQSFKDPRWLNLLRYRKGIFGYKSEADSLNFFLHPKGKINPKLELEETKKKFLISKKRVCDFPARAITLERLGEIPKVSLKHCDKYQKLKKKLNLHSVSLVFSSYFVSKPASAFGHTFFRLRSKDSVKNNNELLDYGLDFSAKVTTNNPFMYGVLGIIGGFDGLFKLMPYYYKVREYNDMENRDLWSYELNLNQSDLDLFVAHLHEMSQTSFDYFYFSENCSYHILAFIDAIKPQWKLMDSLGAFVPPLQTLHALYKKESFVKKVSLRPSLNKKLRKRYELLSQEEKLLFKKIIKNNNLKDFMEVDSSTLNLNVFNVVSDYFDFRDSQVLLGEKNGAYKKAMARKFKINLLRSKIESKDRKVDLSEEYKEAPHLSHFSRRVKIGYSIHPELRSVDFDFRFALHDLMDKAVGFIPFSTTELGRLNFRYDKNNKIRLNKVAIVGVDALRPYSFLEKPLSWRFELGLQDNVQTQSQEVAPFLNLSLGASLRERNFLFSLFLKTQQSFSHSFQKGYYFDFGPEFLLLYRNSFLNFSTQLAHLFSTNDSLRSHWQLESRLRVHFSRNNSVYFKHQKNEFLSNEDIFSLGYALHY